MNGQKLAHYEIQDQLGKGGMGEVYRALDTKLSRSVALKVLPPAFVEDPQRMGRFAREAQLLAALNHPNIAAVYGIEQEGATHALIMELVEGQTLQKRIDRGPIPLEEAARIGLELAKAVEYAHEKGIIHRDLKPANIMLDGDGHVKVLDFGLAKALEEERTADEIGNSPTMTAAATQAGIILGTAAYMSPEQASGSSTDRRADIWSYGVVLSEMLSGRRQFSGETVSHTLASVLKDEPNWEELPPQIPARIVDLLRRCLQKHPKQRLQAIGEARVLWEEFLADPDSFRRTTAVRSTAASRPMQILPWVLTALAIAAAVFVWSQRPSVEAEESLVQRFSIPLRGTPSYLGNISNPPVISPDGKLIAFGMSTDESADQIWIRPVGGFEPYPLPGTTGAFFAYWSPDSRHLGFFMNGRLRKVEISSQRVQTIGEESVHFSRGGSWTSDQQILFSPNSNTGIWVVNAAGGRSRQITFPDSNIADASHRWPHALPDGKHFLYLLWTNDAEALDKYGGIYVTAIDGSMTPRRVVPDASSVVYTKSGHLLVMQEHNLVAIPFNPKSFEVVGEAFIIADGVLLNRNNGYAAFTASDEGTLIYANGLGVLPNATYVWSDRSGKLSTALLDESPVGARIRLSRDGTLATTTNPGPSGDPEVWVLNLERGVRRQLTPSASYSYEFPTWNTAGDRIAYSSAADGTWHIYARNADGSGSAEVLLSDGLDKTVADWRDDKILYWADDAAADGSWIRLHDQKTGKTVDVLEGEPGTAARLSPDLNYVVYSITVAGRSQIMIHAIESGARWQVSADGGRTPHWRDDGREIVYTDLRRRVMAVEIVPTEGSLNIGATRELFQLDGTVAAMVPTKDHDRFLVASRPQEEVKPLRVVLNWAAAKQ